MQPMRQYITCITLDYKTYAVSYSTSHSSSLCKDTMALSYVPASLVIVRKVRFVLSLVLLNFIPNTSRAS